MSVLLLPQVVLTYNTKNHGKVNIKKKNMGNQYTTPTQFFKSPDFTKHNLTFQNK